MVKDKNVDKAKGERQQEIEDARTNLISQFLHLGATMKRISQAVEAYALAINSAGSTEEVLSLLRAPPPGSLPPSAGLPEMFLFLQNNQGLGNALSPENGATAATSKSSRKRKEEYDEEVEGGKKKKVKKEKDPNAPKRPMSAYLLFQNAVREEMKAKNPDLPYKELINQVGEAWKQLGSDGQEPYKKAAEEAMSQWKKDSAEYTAGKGDPHDDDDAEVEEAVVSKKEKKERKSKKEINAPATSTVSTPVEAKKKTPASKKDLKPGATSTPVAKNVAPPKPAASAASKKNMPPPPPESESSSDVSDDASDDESESD